MNPKEAILFRHHAQKLIRTYFFKQDFIEAMPKLLIKANAPDPFIDPLLVYSEARQEGFQLNTSPEIALKKTMSLGFDKIFSLGKVFRDDPKTKSHALEFLMLEWYRKDEDISNLKQDCQNIFSLILDLYAMLTNNPSEKPKIRSVTVEELFLKTIGIDLKKIQQQIEKEPSILFLELEKKGEKLRSWANFSDCFFHVWIKYIEPSLNPDEITFVDRWPAQLSALSSICADDKNFCDRFEIYFRGLEIANAYQECNDPDIIRSRFITENDERELLGKERFEVEAEFYNSLKNLGKMSGIALGFDRLLMAAGKFSDIEKILG